jgi:excisionase family DNA binding protein
MVSQSPAITQPGLLRPLTYEEAAERRGVKVRTLQRAAAARGLRVIRYGHWTVRIGSGDPPAWCTAENPESIGRANWKHSMEHRLNCDGCYQRNSTNSTATVVTMSRINTYQAE